MNYEQLVSALRSGSIVRELVAGQVAPHRCRFRAVRMTAWRVTREGNEDRAQRVTIYQCVKCCALFMTYAKPLQVRR
jgi:hypothetical protein